MLTHFRLPIRSGFRALALLGASLLITVCGGGGTDENGCAITSVTVQPNAVTLTLGTSTTLTATVASSNCTPAPVVTWSSSNPGQVSIQPNGNSVQVTGDALTSIRAGLAGLVAPATITATAGTPVRTGTSQVTVEPAPTINLNNNTNLTFNAVEGGANPTIQVVIISNGGGGVLSGLALGTITYGAGASGWLGAPVVLPTTAAPTANLALQPTTGALTPGVYTATVPVTSTVASNSPQNVSVTFTVVAATPLIGLSSSALNFTAIVGGADPASQGVNIANAGTGTLDNLALGTIVYGPGASGWLGTPGLSSTTAPATLTFQPATGALAVGTYTATVPVTSTVAPNSPQNITVTFEVEEVPLIGLAPTSLTFNATAGGANPVSQVVIISNAAGGTLTGLGVGTITYGAGATGWLQAPNLSSTTANPTATLTIQPVTAGLTSGSYTATVPVTSTSASNSPQNIDVTFNVAPALAVTAFVGGVQTGLVGFATNIRPAVRLTDGGVPVAGTSVQFDVTGGGGSVTGATVNTDVNGVAQVGSWTLGGAAGQNTLTATVTGAGITGNPVTFTATGSTPTFDITIQNVGPAFTAPVQAAFDAAVAKWEQIIYGDLADIANFTSNAGDCGDGTPAIGPVTIDDVLILARIDSIDGPSQVLGQAGPCFIRTTGRLTIVGVMTFDSADVANLVTAGSLNSVILHEMGHVLGFGSLWTQLQFDCLESPSNPPGTIQDTFFDCASARAMFDSIGGTAYTGGNKVPVENCGPASPMGCGLGTVNSHWREPTFGNELMTGYLNNGVSNPLSRLSAASMEDIGYRVNYAGSDAYTRVFSLRAGPAPGALHLRDDVYRGPIRVVDANGRVVGVIQQR